MRAGRRRRLGRVWVGGMVLTVAGGTVAAEPPPVGRVGPTAPVVIPAVAEIEQFHGTVRVVPAGRREAVSVAPGATPATPREPARSPVTEALVEALRTLRDGSHKLTTATTEYVVKATERLREPVETRPVVITNHTVVPATPPATDAAPWLKPVPSLPTTAPSASGTVVGEGGAVPSSAPAVVVVRDPVGDGRSAPDWSSGVLLGAGVAAAVGLGIAVLTAGLMIGYAATRRRDGAMRSSLTPAAVPVAVPPLPVAVTPVSPNDVLLMGRYNAGPRRETAERFEIGPSYQDEQAEKKKARAEQQQALVAFILSQNVALHEQLAASAAGEPAAA